MALGNSVRKLSMAVVLLVAAALAWARARPKAQDRPPLVRSALWFAILVGLVELLGTMSYARGAEVGLLSIVTAASATYPLIPVLGGVTLFHERPAPTQYIGVAMVVGGLIALALA